MRKTALVAFLSLSAALSAQSVTSPEALTNLDGVSNSSYPFSRASARFQQTMTDLKGSAKTFKWLGVRPDAPFSCGTCTARTVDVEIIMAHTNSANLTTTFASNYVGSPVTVFPRAQVSLPKRSASTSSPAAPDFRFVFNTPFMFDGTQDFLVDIATWNNSGVGSSYFSDYASSRVYADRARYGTACTSSDQTSAMDIWTLVSTERSSGNPVFRLYWYTNNGPKTAAAATMVGVVNPNQSIPGVCTNLYTNAMLTFPKTSSSTGYFNNRDSAGNYLYVPYNPAFVGATLYSQSVGVDSGSTNAMPVVLSNGVSTKLNGLLSLGYRVQHFSNGSSATGAGPYSNQLVMVFGL